MPTRAETMALRIVFDLQNYTSNAPQRWAGLETIARRLMLTDPKATEAALALAVEKDWLIVEGGHSICLTDAGRRLVKP